MNVALVITSVIAIAGVVAAMTLRNPIHCILSLALGLVGLAGLYLALGAEFVGFTQVLVYVGAVAILAVFALMMTRGGQPVAPTDEEPRRLSSTLGGVAIAALVFAVIAFAIHSYRPLTVRSTQPTTASATDVGQALMHQFVVPLEVVGILLTAALIGAVVVALPERGKKL
jgi:NADH-quinone oxidoreductase subunit J